MQLAAARSDGRHEGVLAVSSSGRWLDEPMPFHVRITLAGAGRLDGDEVLLDLSGDDLETRILTPRREGRPIAINGRTLSWAQIDRVRINETEASSAELLPKVRAAQRSERSDTFISDEWYVAAEGRDVTDELVQDGPDSDRLPASVSHSFFHVHLIKGWFRSASAFNLSREDPTRAIPPTLVRIEGRAARRPGMGSRRLQTQRLRRPASFDRPSRCRSSPPRADRGRARRDD